MIDCHVHVVDPGRFPVPEGPGYKPRREETATAEDLAGVLSRNDVDAAVVVQLSGYGTDNGAILDAVARSGGRWRAIVAVSAEVSDRELDRLSAAGAVGARFNVVNLGAGVLAPRLLDALGERGWVAQVQCRAPLLPDLALRLAGYRGPLVFDHLGLPDLEAGLDEPGFQTLLAFGREGAVIKLSGAFRLSRQPFPHPDLDPFLTALKGAFAPDRRIWGSDWPFVATDRAPAYAETLALLQHWLTKEQQSLALTETPRRLFGFGLSRQGSGPGRIEDAR